MGESSHLKLSRSLTAAWGSSAVVFVPGARAPAEDAAGEHVEDERDA